MSAISDEIRWYRLFLEKTELEIKRIFETYRNMGVEPILIKGWAAAQNYPHDCPRFFSDIDLAIPSSDFDRCLEKNYSEFLTTLNIDLHRELRRLDSSPWQELFARSKLISLKGTDVRVLCPEDHLRVLCTHWLTDGGQYKERLRDIFYAVENRNREFDWELCLESVCEIRRNWIITTIAVAKKYLDLRTEDLPFADELGSYPAWIDKCLSHEWSTDVRLRSIDTCMNDRKLFFKQIRKRLPPNPIQATVESEALFDERSRIPYQIKSIARRFGPSAVRIARESFRRIWRPNE